VNAIAPPIDDGVPPPPPPKKRGLLAVLVGTAPGLERFLLAAVPSIAAAGVAIGVAQLPALLGVGIGFMVFAIVLVATRRAFP
jgi:hypothetical protein